MALPLPQTQQKVLMQTIVLNIAVFLKVYYIIASTTKKEEPLSTDGICAVPCRKIRLKSESAWMQNFCRLKGCEIYFLSVLLLLFCVIITTILLSCCYCSIRTGKKSPTLSLPPIWLPMQWRQTWVPYSQPLLQGKCLAKQPFHQDKLTVMEQTYTKIPTT